MKAAITSGRAPIRWSLLLHCSCRHPRFGIPAALVALLLVRTTAGGVLQPGFDQELLGNVDGRTRAWGIGVADFNNDNHADFVSGDTFGDVHLYLGDGSGGFTNSGIVINQLYHDAYSLTAGDFNGDGSNDFVLARTTDANEGQLHLYLGNGDGTFQVTALGPAPGYEQLGVQIGIAGLDPVSLAAGDVDGDGDIDLVSGERVDTGVFGDTADILLWRNQQAQGSPLSFVSEVLIEGEDRGYSPDPEDPPYYPPKISLHGYGLALGDVTGDDVPDLLVGDTANYLYVYENTGGGTFSPIRYNNISTGTRPYAYARLVEAFTEGPPLAVGDFNDDGLGDILVGNTGIDGGAISLWVNEGPNGDGDPEFTGTGEVGGAGTDARGLATGQLNPLIDDAPDAVFGNYEGDLHALFTNITDTDGDGVIDLVDNAPNHPNAPRIDMNTDGGINYLDQLDNDHDGIGDPADDDDDNDGVPDLSDNAPFVSNIYQTDTDGDGIGDAADPLNDTDSDGDGVTDSPYDATLRVLAMDAKARWSRSDTHFIIRIDALGRLFQNEFVQTFVDAAILTPAEWATNKFDSYNGYGDDPATPGYQVPADLPGGMDCPITVVVIPRLLWKSDPDPDPIAWINARIGNPNLEVSQHGSYHFNNTPLGDWKDMSDRNFYSSESAGLTLEENFQLLRVGQRTLLGQYADDLWILDSGVDPVTAAKVDWSGAAHPLISYAPPYNTSDTIGRDATARLGYRGWSASIVEEEGPLAPFFSPEGTHHEVFDQFGMYHASADLEVDPEVPPGMTYVEFLESITESPGLNTWLIEEVEWSTRYCNDLDRLEACTNAPGGINRENNMVDPARWDLWLTLLAYAKTNGVVMTMGDYALAMQFDNAPTVANADQADSDHDGIGDVIDGAYFTAAEIQVETPGEASLTATLLNGVDDPIQGQTILFFIDTDQDGYEEEYSAVTDTNGIATVTVTISGGPGTVYTYGLNWDGGLIYAGGNNIVRIGDPVPLMIVEGSFIVEGHFGVTAEGLDPRATYRLMRWTNLLNSPDAVVTNFVPTGSPDTLTDTNPPSFQAFYRIQKE